MKAMKSLTKKAQTMALLLGVTGAVLTSMPLQAEAGQRTLLKNNGLTVQACRIGARTVKFSGWHTAPTKDGFLAGSVRLWSSSFGSINLSQGHWVGDWRGGRVSLKPRYVTVRRNYVSPVHIRFIKGYPVGRGTIYKKHGGRTSSFSVSGLPGC